MRLQHLVIHSDRSVKLAALQALANMALNTTNQKEMEVSWHFTLLNWPLNQYGIQGRNQEKNR